MSYKSQEPISVVIPYCEEYTPESMLREAISSVEEQDVKTETIVIKDPDQNGPAWARNQGLKQASTRYVAFLDADDLWFEHKLERQLEEMRRTGAGICIEHSESTYDEFLYDLLLGSLSSITPSILIDTEQVDIRFEESLSCREDHLFVLEAASESGVCFCDDLVDIRKHDQGFSSTADLESAYNCRRKFSSLVEERVPDAEDYVEEFRIKNVELRLSIQFLRRFQFKRFIKHLGRALHIGGPYKFVKYFIGESIRYLTK